MPDVIVPESMLAKLVSCQPVTQRRQVSLRSLLAWTAYFGGSSALAARYGLGLFVLLSGIFLTGLSFRGYLWWMQTNRVRPRAFGLAWLTIGVSLGMPAFAIQGCGTAPPRVHAGWQAAVSTAQTSVEAWEETEAVLNSPDTVPLERWGELAGQWLLVVFWNLPNLLVLISPWLLWRQQCGKGRMLSALFGCAAVSSWTWGAVSGFDLKIGYFVWSLGITVIALARPPDKITVAAMTLVGGLWIALANWM